VIALAIVIGAGVGALTAWLYHTYREQNPPGSRNGGT
jgi:hypothetical protein